MTLLLTIFFLSLCPSVSASTLIGNPTLRVLPEGVDDLHVQTIRLLPCQGNQPLTLAVAPTGGNLAGVPFSVPVGVWCGAATDGSVDGEPYLGLIASFQPTVTSADGDGLTVDVFVDADPASWADIHR